MSTMPQNAPDTTSGANAPAVVRAAERDVDIDAEVRHFADTADGLGAPRPASDELGKMVVQVAALTSELFAGGVAVETNVDPEMRDDVCLLFRVESNGSVEEIVALDKQWHRGLLSIAPQWPGLFCLSIDARE